MSWSFRQIEVFLAVVDEDGFSSAGQRLGMAQPAVSIAIRRLEESLGFRLLDRSGHNVRLTREGTAFLKYARAMRGLLDEAQRDIGRIRDLETGYIAVGAPPTVAGTLLPRVVDAFLQDHPGIRIKVVEAVTETVADGVRNGELDLGFVVQEQTADDLEVTPIQDQPMVACVAASSPLARLKRMSWEQLLSGPLVLFPRGDPQRSRIDDAAATLGKRANVVIEAEGVALIAAMVRAGRGTATLLAAAADGLVGIASVPLPGDAVVPVALCRRRGAVSSLATNAFYNRVAESLQPSDRRARVTSRKRTSSRVYA